MATTFADIQDIHDAVAVKNGGIVGAPHGVFWRQTGKGDLDYNAFIKGRVPVDSLPIIDPSDLKNSNFFVILTNPNGLESEAIPQMPAGGPFITEAGYQVTLSNGRTLTGQEIQEIIAGWLLAPGRFPTSAATLREQTCDKSQIARQYEWYFFRRSASSRRWWWTD